MKFTLSKHLSHSTVLTFVTKEDLKLLPKIQDFEAEKKEIAIRYDSRKAIVYCGLGVRDDVGPAVIRRAAASGLRQALSKKRPDVSVVAPAASGGVAEPWRPALEGALLGAYSFVKYKKDKGTALSALELCGETVPQREAGRVKTICDCVNYSRDLVNENAHIANPGFLAAQARAIAKAGKMSCKVLDEKDLVKRGLRLLAAVGQGSPFPPRLAVIEYRGNTSSKERTAIVGKPPFN